MKHKLQDLIDIEQFQYLQDRLNAIYSFPSAIIDNDGNILTATAWQDICTQFHRKNKDCEQDCLKSDQYILSHLHEANPAVSYRCPRGLVDNATPIIIDGVHYGNFFTGQFFLEQPDFEFFRKQAKEFGFDESAYLEAVKKVPVWSQDQLDHYLYFIKGLIEVITTAGLKKLQEIEARKKIEESEERANTILQRMLDGFWIADTNGRILDVNPAMCQLLGYTRDEMLNLSVADVEANDSPEDIMRRIQQITRDGLAFFESCFRRKDGSVIEIGVSVKFLPERNLFFGFHRDITERKRAEEVSRHLEASLSEAQRIFHLGSWNWDLTTGEIQFSDEMFRLVGMIPGEAKITREVFAKFLHPDEAERILQKFLQSTADHFSGIEHQIVLQDGKIRNMLSRIKAYCDEHGKPLRLLGSTQDITERKLAEEEIRRLNTELEKRVEERTSELREAQEKLIHKEKLAVLGQMAGSIGHELRNPLSVISNAVYFLKLVQPDANEKIKEYLSMIEIETHTAEKIITDLLGFARVKSMDREPVSVSELVQRVLARFPAPASVTVSLDLPASLPKVHVDPRQIEQVLGNLVLNACQAMPEGGRLSVSGNQLSMDTDHWLLITVQDTGEGISPENMSKLFEPLFTTKSKGIGLGLAVSQKLAEANEGRIEVQSEPGVGSTFTLWLPAIQSQERS